MKFSEMQYQRPDYEVEKKKLEDCYEQLLHATDAQTFYEVFCTIQKHWNQILGMYQLAAIRYTLNTKDSFYQEEQSYWDEMMPEYDNVQQKLYKILLNCPWKEELKEKIPPQYFRLIENNMKLFDECVIEEMKEENRLTSAYQKLLGSAQFTYQGNTYNLSSISKLRASKDETVRKETTDLYWGFFENHKEELDDIYDKLVKVRDTIAKKLGFSNYVEYAYLAMQRIGYDKEDVGKFRKKIIEYVVPFNKEQEEKRKERLGRNKLKYYDQSLFYLEGNPTPKGTEEELVEKAESMYQEMNPTLSEIFAMMKNNQLLDLTSREGKTTGGYCQFIQGFSVPFIFANFKGLSDDVEVLTHEFGHSLQAYLSAKEMTKIGTIMEEVVFPTNEAAEIFSIGMEFFTYPWMKNFFQEDTNRYYYQHLISAVSFFTYGALVDHFQEEVYLHPEMTKEERRATWRKLEKMYQPEKDYEGCPYLEEGGYFVRQSHIYENPFYYIDYALAYVAALELWMNSKKDYQKTLETYLTLCRHGGRKSYLELLEIGNLHNPFQTDILKEEIEEMNRYLTHFSKENINE